MAQTKKKPTVKTATPKRVAAKRPAQVQYSQSVVAMVAAFTGLCIAFALFTIFS